MVARVLFPVLPCGGTRLHPHHRATTMPTKQLARPVHSRGDGLSSPRRARLWGLASPWCALDALSYAGWIACFRSPAATIGPVGLFLLGRWPGALPTVGALLAVSFAAYGSLHSRV